MLCSLGTQVALQEQGLLQGIRRVIAVTLSEAEEAMSKAEGLTKALGAAEELSGSQLDTEIGGLRQVHTGALKLLRPASRSVCVSRGLLHVFVLGHNAGSCSW